MGALPWGVTTAVVNHPCWSQKRADPQPGAWLEDPPHPLDPEPCLDRVPLAPSELSPGPLGCAPGPRVRWAKFGGRWDEIWRDFLVGWNKIPKKSARDLLLLLHMPGVETDWMRRKKEKNQSNYF